MEKDARTRRRGIRGVSLSPSSASIPVVAVLEEEGGAGLLFVAWISHPTAAQICFLRRTTDGGMRGKKERHTSRRTSGEEEEAVVRESEAISVAVPETSGYFISIAVVKHSRCWPRSCGGIRPYVSSIWNGEAVGGKRVGLTSVVRRKHSQWLPARRCLP